MIHAFTRMHNDQTKRYSDALAPIVSRPSPPPPRKRLRSLRDGRARAPQARRAEGAAREGIEAITGRPSRRRFRGRLGVSPREVRHSCSMAQASTVVTSHRSPCSPGSGRLCKHVSEYDWLREEAARRQLPRSSALPRRARHFAGSSMRSGRKCEPRAASSRRDLARYGEALPISTSPRQLLGEGREDAQPAHRREGAENADERMMREVEGYSRSRAKGGGSSPRVDLLVDRRVGRRSPRGGAKSSIPSCSRSRVSGCLS
jgi:hypothetical protein